MAYPMQSNYPPQDEAYPSAPGYPQQPPPAPYPAEPAKQPLPEGQGYPAAPPAQQPGYPPQGYPPQEPGYPPQQELSSAPPPPYYTQQQQPAYPQQQQPYPQQQQPYPQQQQQQAATNVVVVQRQPQPVVYQPRRLPSDTGNNAMVFALVLTFFALFSGCFWALVCTIPAILLANSATSSARRGQIESAKNNEKISIGCSVAAIVFGVVGILVIIGGIMAYYFLFVFGSFRSFG